MYFNPDGILMVQCDDRDFWDENDHVSYKAALWFPPNWITIPIAAFREWLEYMRSVYFDD